MKDHTFIAKPDGHDQPLITLTGLTFEQAEMCMLLWECNSVEDLNHLYYSLEASDRPLFNTMRDMMTYDMLDDAIQTESDCEDALEIINRICKR